MSSSTSLDFHKNNESEVRDCSILKRMMLWNRWCKHSSALGSSLSPPFQILTPQPQRRPFSWRVTWKSDCSHLQEALDKLVSWLTSLSEKILSFPGGRPARGARHRSAHFAFGLGSFKNGTNGKSPPSECLIDFKSSEVGTLKTPTFQRSSVQPTIAFSESISNVNLSFCT